MSDLDPNASLETIIDRFIADSKLVHDFTKGDDTLDVIGEDGTYPSLAKIAKNASKLVNDTQIAIQQMVAEAGGLKVIKFSFEAGTRIIFNHKAKTNFYDLSITANDGVVVMAPHCPLDEDNVVVEFEVPESGVAILKLYTALKGV